MGSKQNGKHVPVSSGGKEETKGGTAVVPWRPQDYMGEMDRVFDEFTGRFGTAFAPFSGAWLAPRRRLMHELSQVRHPYADLIDSGSEFRVLAEVPGIPKEKLDITVTDNEIRIEGEARTDIKEEKEGFVRRERGYSRVSRVLVFPEQVVADKAHASLNNGVLEVRVPKKTPTKVTRRKVEVT